jgi:hypothetical protein
MKSQPESELYEPVRHWLETSIKHRFRQCDVRAYDTSRTKVSSLIARLGLQSAFPESSVWDIQADITALVTGKKNHIAFVECKMGNINLRDVGQLLGYSRVARPVAALLLSPKPVTDNLRNLLVVYGRYDILEYDQDGNRIMIVRWDAARCSVMHGATLPPGEHL